MERPGQRWIGHPTQMRLKLLRRSGIENFRCPEDPAFFLIAAGLFAMSYVIYDVMGKHGRYAPVSYEDDQVVVMDTHTGDVWSVNHELKETAGPKRLNPITGKIKPYPITYRQNRMIVREISQIYLSKSQIQDYALNPYVGCSHSCRYCYAAFMRRFTGHREKWGEFVDIKVNAPELLAREIQKKRMGRVWVSGVCDPYQAQNRGTG